MSCRYDVIRAGEPAELLVLSNTRGFSAFKVSPALAVHLACLGQAALSLWQ